MNKGGYTYILTNNYHTVFYVGATSNLERRFFEHKNFLIPGFSSHYRIGKLVYYERHESIESATAREKYLKGKTRAKKIELITSMNPQWKDLGKNGDPSLRSG